MYRAGDGARSRAGAASSLTRAARRDLYQDAVNEACSCARPVPHPVAGLLRQPRHRRRVNGLAALIGGTSGRLRRLQTGFVRSYALSMFAGAALVVGALLLVRL